MNIKLLREIPFDRLPPSGLVDFILFLASEKPAVRLLVSDQNGIDVLRIWCLKGNFDFLAEANGFCCIANEHGYASKILEIDRCIYPHEIKLGQMLGYPLCCSERISQIGESNIDAFSSEVANWTFQGDFRRINPIYYSVGGALISHIPCSPTCEASLAIANRAREFVLANISEPILSEFSRSVVRCV